MPPYIAPIILTSATTVIGALALMAAATARRAAPTLSKRVVPPVVVALLSWMVLAVTLSALGAYEADPRGIPTIQFGITLPLILAMLVYASWPSFRQLVHGIPQQWLIGIQVYRAGGALFLALWGEGLMPGFFAVPAGLGDLLVGCTAPAIAFLAARGNTGSRNYVLIWNVLGLLDLALALVLGFVTTPSRFQLLAVDNASIIITQFPLVLIPTFIVPLSILLHLVSLAKLRAGRG